MTFLAVIYSNYFSHVGDYSRNYVFLSVAFRRRCFGPVVQDTLSSYTHGEKTLAELTKYLAKCERTRIPAEVKSVQANTILTDQTRSLVQMKQLPVLFNQKSFVDLNNIPVTSTGVSWFVHVSLEIRLIQTNPFFPVHSKDVPIFIRWYRTNIVGEEERDNAGTEYGGHVPPRVCVLILFCSVLKASLDRLHW